MFIYMNNSNYMSNRDHFKDIGTFLSKNVNAQSLDDLKIVKCSSHNFAEYLSPNQRSLSLKMAEIWPIL